jgi:hypothetical protein
VNKNNFFSLAELKQPVNQWICIAFIGVLCFWVVLYYTTEQAKSIGGFYDDVRSSINQTI